MDYRKRTVQSQPGLSQEQALLALQSHTSFKPGTRIASIRRKGTQWVASILEPKEAGPPAFADDGESDSPFDSAPADDSGESSPPDSEDSSSPDSGSSDSEDGSSGPPSPDGGGDEKKPGKPNVEAEILHVLTQILQALGGDGGPEGMGGPDSLGPDAGGPAAPPHHGPPHGGPPKGGPAAGPGAGPAPSGRPMRPGEAPPGSTPVGAPAFSHTKQANPGMPTAPGAPVPSGTVGPQAGGTTCAQCGYPEPCPIHGAAAAPPMSPAVAAVREQVQKVAGRSAQVTIKAPGDMRIGDAVKVAKEAAEPFGYVVKKASRVDNRIIILAYARR